MHTLHSLALVEQFTTALATAWAFCSELFTAAALLWCLNSLANLIRLIVKTTRFCWTAGQVTGRFLKPWIWRAADAISYVNSQIDWAAVRAVITTALTVSVAAIITLFTVIIPAAYSWVERNFIDVPVALETAPCKSTKTTAAAKRLAPACEVSKGFGTGSGAVVLRRRHGRLVAC